MSKNWRNEYRGDRVSNTDFMKALRIFLGLCPYRGEPENPSDYYVTSSFSDGNRRINAKPFGENQGYRENYR